MTKSIPAYLRAACAARPDTTALVLDGRDELTFHDWQRRSNSFAANLLTRGIKPGDRVGLIYPGENWLEFAIAYFGVLTVGATALLIPHWMDDAERQDVVDRHQPVLVVHGPAASASASAGPVCRHEELEAAGSDEVVPIAATAHTVAEIIFTSATTGAAKGVEATHAGLMYRDKKPDPAVLMHPLPLGTTAAQMLLVDAVRGQQTLVLMSAFQPRGFCRLVERYRPVWVGLSPAMGAMLVRAREARRWSLTSVQALTFVSAPLQPATLSQLRELFPEAVIRNYYSSTEASPAGVGTVFDPARPTSVGRPEDWCAVRIVDDSGRQLAAGQTGEVLLRAEGVAARRYADDEAASEAVFQDGWVRTGDLGHLDDDGFLYLDDRKADVVNTGGRKVAAQEVERVLCEHPAISEAAVFGRPHPVLGEAVTAAVIAEHEVEAADLIKFCMDRLAGFKVPNEVILMDEFPRGALGKPLKRVLAGRG